MEIPSKRSTAAINRRNFENARKILFGTDIIPGTNRERWTTAGKTQNIIGEHTFQLGPHEFKIYGGSIFLGDFDIGWIMEREVRLDISTSESELVIGDSFKSRHMTVQLFYQEGQIYFNYSASNTQMIYTAKDVMKLSNLYPRNIGNAREIYRNMNLRGERTGEIVAFNGKQYRDSQIVLEKFESPLPEGVIELDGRGVAIISSGLSGIQVGISRFITRNEIAQIFKRNDEICMLKMRRKDRGYTLPKKTYLVDVFWFLSDLEKIADALNWLMHVLTGPDPRTYNSPIDSSRILPEDLKESSEPRQKYWTFERDEFGMMHLKGNTQRLTFFVEDTRGLSAKQAQLIRNMTIAYLTHRTGGFLDNFAKFAQGAQFPGDAPPPYSYKEFQQALSRLQQFEEHEFLGCAACKSPNPKFKCAHCSDTFYCNETCQKNNYAQHITTLESVY